jgi:teichuronic acid biosynthesis glycosyltransferase TuaC
MKVLVITNLFPNSAEKTRGIFTYQIVKALQRKCVVGVVAPLPWLPPFFRDIGAAKYPHANVPLKETIEDIAVHHPRYLVIPKILGFLHALFLFFPLLQLVKKIEKHEEIDLINAHWVFPDGVAALWVGKMLNKPVVLTGLGCDVNLYSMMPLRRFQILKALQKAAHVTVVSNSMKKRIISMGISGERVDVIPNGINLKLFDVMERKRVRRFLDLPVESRIVLTIGSQDEVKGTKYLIEAFGMLRRRIKGPLLLILIGDGPLKESLMSMTENLNLNERVAFLGRKPHSEIPLWLNAADVFCLPSIREGHPNVVLEALACGVPVVASNVGGIPEMIHDNGMLSPPADSTKLCDNLEFCLSNNWDRNAIRSTFGGFSWMACARMYFKSYRRAIKTN